MGFGTKDSSDSKSHDSGIDSIEKPDMSFGVFKVCGVHIDPTKIMNRAEKNWAHFYKMEYVF